MFELQSYLVYSWLTNPQQRNGCISYQRPRHFSTPIHDLRLVPHAFWVRNTNCYDPYSSDITITLTKMRATHTSKASKLDKKKLHSVGAVKTLPALVRAATARYALLLPSVRKAHSPNKWCHNIRCSQECPMGYARSSRSNTLIKDKVNNSIWKTVLIQDYFTAQAFYLLTVLTHGWFHYLVMFNSERKHHTQAYVSERLCLWSWVYYLQLSFA
jgi:hypothetical protein